MRAGSPRRGWIGGAAVLASLAAPASGHADVVLAEVDRPTSIAAHAGNVAWSAYDAEIDAYRLMLSVDGLTPVRVDVAPRSVPFDVDVGPVQSTGVHAVYSRCERDPGIARPGGLLPAYNEGSGCDLSRVELQTGDERRIALQSRKRASEYLPSLWRNRIAFARRFEERSGVRGVRPKLFLADRLSVEGRRKLRPGPRVAAERQGSRFDRVRRAAQPIGIDVRDRRVAVVWWMGPDRSQLRSVRPGAARVLASGPALGGPLQAGSVSVVAQAGDEVRRYSVSSGEVLSRGPIGAGRSIVHAARDQSPIGTSDTYYVDMPAGAPADPTRACGGPDGSGTCRVVLADPDPLG